MTTYNYERPLKKYEVLVLLFDEQKIYPALSHEISNAADQYGFTYLECNKNKPFDDSILSGYKIKHAIIFDGVDNPNLVTDKYLSSLEKFTSATLAISYSNETSFRMASPAIKNLKKSYGHKINYLRPTYDKGKFLPSIDKLIDNSICDSVRIKYRANNHLKKLGYFVTPDIHTYFIEASKLIVKYSLYHRSETDGFISIRCPSGGFFITSTKTNKVDLDMDRITLVHNYDEKENVILYSGKYLPSSDSVEASIIYQNMPDITAILHTHASEYFTRNRLFSHKIAVPPMRYGEPTLGKSLVKFISAQSTYDFAIMEDHGEIFLATAKKPLLAIQKIENIIATNIEKTKKQTRDC